MKAATWHFYDLGTGLLSGASFSGTAGELAEQLAHKGPGVGAHEGECDHACQKVCLVTSALIDHKPDPPWDGTDLTLWVWWWDASVKRWKLRPRLKKFKTDRWAEIKAARDAAIDEPLHTEFGAFDHDARSRQAIFEMTSGAGLVGSEIEITLADNTQVKLTAKQIKAVLSLSHARVQSQRQIASRLRSEIEAARNNKEVAAIAWAALPNDQPNQK